MRGEQGDEGWGGNWSHAAIPAIKCPARNITNPKQGHAVAVYVLRACNSIRQSPVAAHAKCPAAYTRTHANCNRQLTFGSSCVPPSA